MIPFVKGHGLGNDYIVIDGRDLPAPLTVPQVVRICDRNWGVGSDGILLKVPLQVGSEMLLVTAVSVGNPHCVVFVDVLDEARVRALGPQIERHPAFPNRINVQFARVASRSQVDILIWERGAGYTLASGSSSSAVACAAVKNGLCDHGLVTVRMPGGTLEVDVRPDWSIRLKGPVEEVYAGTFSRDLMEALKA